MFLPRKFEVLVLLCVLVGSSRGLDAGKGRCGLIVEDEIRSVRWNCSEQGFATVPKWPDQFSKINEESHVQISFSKNKISNITKLESVPGSQIALSFQANRVVEIVAGAFSNLDKLIFLDLSNNSLSGEVLRSEIFQGPYDGAGAYSSIALEKLYLSFNEIHSLDHYLFQYTPNLTELWLDHNPIEVIDHVTKLALSSAVNLKILDLSYTSIESIPFDAFLGLVYLDYIDLSGNRFVTVPESLKVVGKSLKFLLFNNNHIVELNDDSFVGLTSLEELEIGENNYLEEVKRSTFSPLRSLKVLHLCHNRNLRYISHKAFRGLEDSWTLNKVYLDDNNLSELSTDLMPWSKLDVLGMTGNNWLCNCDLANIVTTQGAGQKFEENLIPFCAAPMRLHGQYLTNITDHLSFCPTFDSTIKEKKSFSLASLRPKHVLWSIIGVALVVVIGILLGLLVNVARAFYNKKIRSQPVRYVNLNEDGNFTFNT